MISSPPPDANLLFELREIAKHCSSAEHAKALRMAADELAGELGAVISDPTTTNMTALNNAWMHALRAWRAAPPLGGDATQGGAVRLTAEQRAA